MGWIKQQTRPAAEPTRPSHTRGREGFLVPKEVQEKLAGFLARHGRFVPTPGHLRLQILATTSNHDGSTDYSVRTFVRSQGMPEEVFTSHVRMYATEHMRLVR